MSRKIRNLRWWMIGLVMLGAVINYLARSTLGVAAPAVLADLHIGPREYSWITGAFQLGVMLQPLCGYVLDSIGLKLGFALFATAWSLITMAHGLAGNWQVLLGLLMTVLQALRASGGHEGGVDLVSGQGARPGRRGL